MSIVSKQLGQAGERLARHYLEQRGLRFVDANVVTRYGELDLIMRQRRHLVFVEVKTRRTHAQGFPQEAVTERKLRRLSRAATTYVRAQRHAGPWRIDVVAITTANHPTQIVYLPNVTAASSNSLD